MLRKLKQKLLELALECETNIDFEKQMYQVITETMAKIIGEVLEDLDNKLVANMKAKDYEIERKDSRTIQFLVGDVHFTRRLYNRGKESVYALDKYLNFKPRVRYSPVVQAEIAKLTAKGEFQKVANAVNGLTPLSISAHGVHQMTQRIAEDIANHEENKNELVLPEKKQVPVLFLEGDALMVKSINKADRLMTIHRFQVHEGVKKSGKRSECLNVRQFAESSRRKAFKKMLKYLHSHYDLKNTTILSCSDGGSGYEPAVFYELALGCKRHEHFLDRYHLMRKIKERTYFCKTDLVKLLKQAVFDYDKDKLDVVLDTIESVAAKDSSKALEFSELLRAYLYRNWEYIKPIKLRKLSDLKGYKGLGVCESRHRPFAYRMKKQGRAWSKQGGRNMVRLINCIQNGDFEEVIRSKWEAVIEKLDDVKVNMAKLLNGSHADHTIKQGIIVNFGSSSSSMGTLKKSFNKNIKK